MRKEGRKEDFLSPSPKEKELSLHLSKSENEMQPHPTFYLSPSFYAGDVIL